MNIMVLFIVAVAAVVVISGVPIFVVERRRKRGDVLTTEKAETAHLDRRTVAHIDIVKTIILSINILYYPFVG